MDLRKIVHRKRIGLNGRAPTRRLLRACCRFGLGVTRHAPIESSEPDLESLRALAPGELALVTGPSGSGKTRLLRVLTSRLRSEREHALLRDLSAPVEGGRAVIDLIPLPLNRALRLLAAAGLADPFALGRTVRELSTGERARFVLARSLVHRRDRPGWLLIDEFLTMLDRATAIATARSFRRAAQEFAPDLRIVVATAVDDIAPAICADVVVRV